MYESKIKDEHTELLVKAILELRTPEECYRLFRCV